MLKYILFNIMIKVSKCLVFFILMLEIDEVKHFIKILLIVLLRYTKVPTVNIAVTFLTSLIIYFLQK